MYRKLIVGWMIAVAIAVVAVVACQYTLSAEPIPPWYQCGESCCDSGCQCHPKAKCSHEFCNLCAM